MLYIFYISYASVCQYVIKFNFLNNFILFLKKAHDKGVIATEILPVA